MGRNFAPLTEAILAHITKTGGAQTTRALVEHFREYSPNAVKMALSRLRSKGYLARDNRLVADMLAAEPLATNLPETDYMTPEERRSRLSEIARSGAPQPAISAIRTLHDLESGHTTQYGPAPPSSPEEVVERLTEILLACTDAEIEAAVTKRRDILTNAVISSPAYDPELTLLTPAEDAPTPAWAVPPEQDTSHDEDNDNP